MISLAILNSAAFGLYGNCKLYITKFNSDLHYQWLDDYKYFIAGFGVGVGSAAISTPFEVVKVRMQHVSGSKYSGSFDVARSLVKEHGVSVLYTGHVVNLIREAVFCTFYFGAYETLKIGLTKFFSDSGYPQPQLAILASGGFAGMLGWLTSYPLDVVKNLKQTQPLEGNWLFRGEFSHKLAYHRWLAHGIGGFYRGIRPSLIRAWFVSSLRFSAYEFVIRLWRVYNH